MDNNILSQFSNLKIAVIGDLMLDRYIYGKVSRISPEAPVPIVDVDITKKGYSYRLGGSGNVANNIASFGISVELFAVIGKNDEASAILKKTLDDIGIISSNVVCIENRPTTIKTRIIAHGQQIVRFDIEDRSIIPEENISELYSSLNQKLESFDAIIVSDYAKGVVDNVYFPVFLQNAIKMGKIVTVDPKVSNIALYKNATLITPNKLEACQVSGISLDSAHSEINAGKFLLKKLGKTAIVITLGEDGILLLKNENDIVHIPTQAVEVYDVTGAGDTVISVLTAFLSAGFSIEQSVIVANAAAGIVVGKAGTTSITQQEIDSIIKKYLT